jgi:hypothetical protein
MRNYLILLITVLVFSSASAQDNAWLQSRVLTVDAADVEKFESAVAKKTKMYNSEEGTPIWFTFRILTGQNSNQYLRVQYITSPDELDNVDIVGNAYWQKTVGPYHKAKDVRLWGRSNNTSYNPGGDRVNLRRIIYYKYDSAKEDDFWRFRWRVKRAMEESGYDSRMSVLVCQSGCNGNVVQVRFHHNGWVGQTSDYGEPLAAMVEKYNEMFGEDAYEQDSDRMNESLLPEGSIIRHHELLPELSSAWRNNN